MLIFDVVEAAPGQYVRQNQLMYPPPDYQRFAMRTPSPKPAASATASERVVASLLVTHVSNRNGAFAANRAAVNDADECSSVSAAQNFYFASLRGLATQQWSYDALVVDGAAPPFVEATKRIGVLEDPDCLRIVFVAQHLRVAGGYGRDRYHAGYEAAPKHKRVLVLRPAGRYQFQDGLSDCFFTI
jgi:hypothetical protein